MGGKRAKLQRRAKASAEARREKKKFGKEKVGDKSRKSGTRGWFSLAALLLFFFLRQYRDWNRSSAVRKVARNATFAGVTFQGQAPEFPTLARASASATAVWNSALDGDEWAAAESCGFWSRGKANEDGPAVVELQWSGSDDVVADPGESIARRLIGFGGCPVVLRGGVPLAVAEALSGAA